MTRTSSESALVVSAATDSLLARGRGGEKKFAILQIPQTLLSLQYTAIATLWPNVKDMFEFISVTTHSKGVTVRGTQQPDIKGSSSIKCLCMFPSYVV